MLSLPGFLYLVGFMLLFKINHHCRRDVSTTIQIATHCDDNPFSMSTCLARFWGQATGQGFCFFPQNNEQRSTRELPHARASREIISFVVHMAQSDVKLGSSVVAFVHPSLQVPSAMDDAWMQLMLLGAYRGTDRLLGCVCVSCCKCPLACANWTPRGATDSCLRGYRPFGRQSPPLSACFPSGLWQGTR